MIGGNIILNPGDYAMTFTITDLNGNVTASASSRGSDFWKTYESASAGLINQLCNPTVEFLDGLISITIESSKYMPDQKNQRENEITSTSISGKISVRIIRDRILNYIGNPNFRRDCDPLEHCPVVEGGSDFQARDPNDYSKIIFANRYPLIVSKKESKMGFRGIDGKEKYVTTFNSTASDTNAVEGLHLEIKTYVAGEGQLAPLSPNYLIWLTGGKYLDKLRIHPMGKGGASQWDINKEKLVPIPDPVSVGIPYSIAQPEADMSLYKIYDPLLIENYREFEEYLLNPIGTFSISAAGIRSENSENYNLNTSVSVTISFSPHETNNMVKKEN
jgi:hypothetical protein